MGSCLRRHQSLSSPTASTAVCYCSSLVPFTPHSKIGSLPSRTLASPGQTPAAPLESVLHFFDFKIHSTFWYDVARCLLVVGALWFQWLVWCGKTMGAESCCLFLALVGRPVLGLPVLLANGTTFPTAWCNIASSFRSLEMSISCVLFSEIILLHSIGPIFPYFHSYSMSFIPAVTFFIYILCRLVFFTHCWKYPLFCEMQGRYWPVFVCSEAGSGFHPFCYVYQEICGWKVNISYYQSWHIVSPFFIDSVLQFLKEEDENPSFNC
jgi:hypothetical protein